MRNLRLWLPCFSLMLVSLISYVDRSTLALLSPTILEQTHLSNEQYGLITSAFSIAYMFSNFLWGWLLDRVGLWTGMLAAVGLWSLASAGHALANGFWGFALARALLGACEGATFPGGLRAAALTLPPERRSRGIAIAYSGGSLGAIVAPLIITPVALHRGWRQAFIFTGLLGAAWMLVWLLLGREDAALRARHVAVDGEQPAAPQKQVSPRDARFWAFVGSYALGAFPLAFVLYQTPIYLNKALGQTQEAIGHWLWLPPLGWEVGYFFWGWICDRRAKAGVPVRHARVLALLVLLSAPLALTPALPGFPYVMGELFVAMFMAGGFIIVSIDYAIGVFSKQNAALIAGLGSGSWSAGVVVGMPLIGRMFDAHAYAASFVVTAICPAIGFVVWYLLDGSWQSRQRNLI